MKRPAKSHKSLPAKKESNEEVKDEEYLDDENDIKLDQDEDADIHNPNQEPIGIQLISSLNALLFYP